MSSTPQFKAAYPYQDNVLALPVSDLDAAAQWYSNHFGMREVERVLQPVPTVILERDGTRIGFAISGSVSPSMVEIPNNTVRRCWCRTFEV